MSSGGEVNFRVSFAALIAACAVLCVPGAGMAAQTKRAAPVTAGATPARKAVPAIWYDFKGAKLGMPLDEWKALVPPVKAIPGLANLNAGTDGPDRAWCSDDRTPDGKTIADFYLSDVEKALGVVTCKYAKLSTFSSSYSPTRFSLTSSFVAIGDAGTDDIEYKFLNGKLYSISVSGGEELLKDVLDGLTTKFGEPTVQVNDTTQNRAGATFRHLERAWLNPAASIVLETPFSRIDDLNVTYIAVDAGKQILEKRRELHPAADKM